MKERVRSSLKRRPPPLKIMRTPRTLDVEITSRCNLHCRYCYFFDNPAVKYADLPGEEWIRFFDECGDCAVMSLTLAGGEPFMRADLPQLLEAIVRNRMRFSILSNGGLIDNDIASYIAETGRCDTIQISLDGAEATAHDSCRGEGSFIAAVNGIRTLQRHRIPVTVRVTIHHYNVDQLEDVAHLLLEELRLPQFSTNAAGYLGSCRSRAEELLLTTQDRQLAMQTLLQLSEKYAGRISATAGPLAEGKLWNDMEQARKRQAPPFSYGGRLSACGCSRQKMAVRADGTMIPCSMLTHIELGRINRDSLEIVWRESPALSRLRQRAHIPLTIFEFCRDCPYIPYCTGNCPGLAYSLTGQIDHPSPDACLRRFLEDGGRLETIHS